MDNDAGSYRVVYLDPVRKFLKICIVQAKSKGIGAEILRKLVELDTRLKEDPRGFGDPWNTYGNLEIYHRTFIPFDVAYGIHSTSRHVFVRAIRAYPSDFFEP